MLLLPVSVNFFRTVLMDRAAARASAPSPPFFGGGGGMRFSGVLRRFRGGLERIQAMSTAAQVGLGIRRGKAMHLWYR